MITQRQSGLRNKDPKKKNTLSPKGNTNKSKIESPTRPEWRISQNIKQKLTQKKKTKCKPESQTPKQKHEMEKEKFAVYELGIV